MSIVDSGVAAEPELAPEAPAPDGVAPSSDEGFESLEGEYDKLLAQGDKISVSKADIERFKREHIGYRQRYKPVEQAFRGVDPQYRDQMMAWWADFRTEEGRPHAIEWMRSVFDSLSPAQQAAVTKAVESEVAAGAATPAGASPLPAGELPKFLTQAEAEKLADERAEALFNRKTAEREQTTAVEEAGKQIRTRAAELGKKLEIPEFGDPSEALFTLLMSTAQNLPSGDPLERLDVAAEKVRDYLDRTSQKFLKAKITAGAGSASPQGGTEPTGARKPMTLDDATKSAVERIDLAFRASEKVGT